MLLTSAPVCVPAVGAALVAASIFSRDNNASSQGALYVRLRRDKNRCAAAALFGTELWQWEEEEQARVAMPEASGCVELPCTRLIVQVSRGSP